MQCANKSTLNEIIYSDFLIQILKYGEHYTRYLFKAIEFFFANLFLRFEKCEKNNL